MRRRAREVQGRGTAQPRGDDPRPLGRQSRLAPQPGELVTRQEEQDRLKNGNEELRCRMKRRRGQRA